MAKRLFIIVLDSFGMGALPDAALFGDEGSNTLAAVAASPRFHAPHLQALGLFNIQGTVGGQAVDQPLASFARMAEKSPGKDTTVGHWELAGAIAKRPLPTYPDGFPEKLLDQLYSCCHRQFICNRPYSGTDVLREYGLEHIRTGKPILYTSADSVMQIAAHEDIIPLSELYEICQAARALMQGEHGVGRIIARPFTGDPPDFVRTPNRRDYSLPPPAPTLLDILRKGWLDVIAIGKIHDIFAGKGISRTIKTGNNTQGMEQAIAVAGQNFSGLCFVNLVDFDMLYGHRNDVDGYAQAISDFDLQLGEFAAALGPDDAVILTADHGCDPSTPSTDHSREYVPMLMFGDNIRRGVDLGTRSTFADVAATAQAYFGLGLETQGTSFLGDVLL